MHSWAWNDHLAPWVARYVELPMRPLFCVIERPTRGRQWSATSLGGLRRYAALLGFGAGSRRISFLTRTRSSSHASGCRCLVLAVSVRFLRAQTTRGSGTGMRTSTPAEPGTGPVMCIRRRGGC